jgi:hypothetical protein
LARQTLPGTGGIRQAFTTDATGDTTATTWADGAGNLFLGDAQTSDVHGRWAQQTLTGATPGWEQRGYAIRAARRPPATPCHQPANPKGSPSACPVEVYSATGEERERCGPAVGEHQQGLDCSWGVSCGLSGHQVVPVNPRAHDLLRQDPEGFLAWLNARQGVLGTVFRDDPRLAQEFWREVILGDPRREPDYHMYRLYGLGPPMLGSGLVGIAAGALAGWLSLDSRWMLIFIPIVGFMFLLCWRGVMYWLANGRAERLPAGLMRSNWLTFALGMVLATGAVTMVIAA